MRVHLLLELFVAELRVVPFLPFLGHSLLYIKCIIRQIDYAIDGNFSNKAQQIHLHIFQRPFRPDGAVGVQADQEGHCCSHCQKENAIDGPFQYPMTTVPDSPGRTYKNDIDADSGYDNCRIGHQQ